MKIYIFNTLHFISIQQKFLFIILGKFKIFILFIVIVIFFQIKFVNDAIGSRVT